MFIDLKKLYAEKQSPAAIAEKKKLNRAINKAIYEKLLCPNGKSIIQQIKEKKK